MGDLDQAWDARIDGLERRLPDRARRAIRWIREPHRRWLRMVAALAFILGGIFSILPVLGLWMLPVGVALLAQDVPWVKGPAERIARRLEGAWRWCARLVAPSSGPAK